MSFPSHSAVVDIGRTIERGEGKACQGLYQMAVRDDQDAIYFSAIAVFQAETCTVGPRGCYPSRKARLGPLGIL